MSYADKFPPTPSKKYVKLALVKQEDKRRDYDKLMKHKLHGKVDEILKCKTEITTADILKQDGVGRPLKVVLVEGPPGIGKSTLAWELCRRWDRAQYDLVVLLRLRELEHMDDIEDLFPHDDKELRTSVAKEVLGRDGKGVLFVLDGYDELSSSLKSSRLLKRLLRGESLPECTILITSRPSASHELVCHPQRHVEILGFTQENIKEYASSVFSSEPEVLKDFLFYVSASENPAINSLMYIPLNAAIIVEIYSHTRKQGLPIPKTLTQLYTQLCLILVQRDVAISSSVLTKLSDIPAEYSTHFQQLSKLAYETFTEQKLVFYSDSVPHASDFVHFGMLDSVVSLYSGRGVSYNFLHLTLQEFLAAYHITQLPSGMDVFKQYGEDPLWNLVWKFVSGLTRFQFFNTLVKNSVFLVSEKKHLEVRMFLMECLFEAQFHLDFKSIYHKHKIVIKSDRESCPLDRYALGYCIAHDSSQVSWDVRLSDNSDEGFDNSDEGFVWGLKSASSVSGNLECLGYNSMWSMCLEQYPIKTLGCIKRLFAMDLYGGFLVEVIPQMKSLTYISLFFTKFSNILELFSAIAHSNVTYFRFDYEKPIGTYNDDLELNDVKTDVFYESMAALMRSNKLQDLELLISEGIDTRCPCILFGPSCLCSLTIMLPDIAWTENSLASLESNTSLTTVHIRNYGTPHNHLPMLTKILVSNKTLQVLEFGFLADFSREDVLRFGRALQSNTTLRKIVLYLDPVYHGKGVFFSIVDSRLITS